MNRVGYGAVSIFVNDTIKLSKYKKDIKVYGSTDSKKVLKQYINIKFKKKFYKSSSNEYLRLNYAADLPLTCTLILQGWGLSFALSTALCTNAGYINILSRLYLHNL